MQPVREEAGEALPHGGALHAVTRAVLHLTQAQAGWLVCHPDQHPTDAPTKAGLRHARGCQPPGRACPLLW